MLVDAHLVALGRGVRGRGNFGRVGNLEGLGVVQPPQDIGDARPADGNADVARRRHWCMLVWALWSCSKQIQGGVSL